MNEELYKQKEKLEKIKAKGFSDLGYNVGNGIAWAGFWIGFAIFFHK